MQVRPQLRRQRGASSCSVSHGGVRGARELRGELRSELRAENCARHLQREPRLLVAAAVGVAEVALELAAERVGLAAGEARAVGSRAVGQAAEQQRLPTAARRSCAASSAHLARRAHRVERQRTSVSPSERDARRLRAGTGSDDESADGLGGVLARGRRAAFCAAGRRRRRVGERSPRCRTFLSAVACVPSDAEGEEAGERSPRLRLRRRRRSCARSFRQA